jgi:hypothetical protein
MLFQGIELVFSHSWRVEGFRVIVWPMKLSPPQDWSQRPRYPQTSIQNHPVRSWEVTQQWLSTTCLSLSQLEWKAEGSSPLDSHILTTTESWPHPACVENYQECREGKVKPKEFGGSQSRNWSFTLQPELRNMELFSNPIPNQACPSLNEVTCLGPRTIWKVGHCDCECSV